MGHTTGAGLPAKALENGQGILDRAVEHYLESHGTNYVISYQGEIIQVANEDMKANGVGMSDQIAAVKKYGESGWTDPSFKGNTIARGRWIGRWDAFHNSPLDLYPGKYANPCYVHAEMPPCVFWYGDMLQIEEEPHRTGLRFTTAQHDAMVRLSIDIADRNKWPEGWWTTGRLVGHEDLSPLTRGTGAGCWDPGWLRENPFFDWIYVKEEIIKVYKRREEAQKVLDKATEEAQHADTSDTTSDKVVADAFIAWIKKILRIKW